MSAIAGEGTAMERDYDFSSALHAADLEAAERIGRTAGERAVARLNPRKVSTRKVPVVFDRRVAGSLVGHLASADQRQLRSRARRASCGTSSASACSSPASASSTIRCAGAACARGRSMARASPASRSRSIEDGVLTTWLLDSATARELELDDHRPRPARRLLGAVARARPTCISKPGAQTPEALIADIADGFYVTELIGMGVNG